MILFTFKGELILMYGEHRGNRSTQREGPPSRLVESTAQPRAGGDIQ
jgi:hypothetical protein